MWYYLLLTFLLEIPVLYFFFRKQEKPGMIVLVGVLLSAFTWPLGMYALNVWHWNLYLIELLIALTESLLIRFYWNPTWQKALLAGFAMNAVSFFIGQVLFSFFPVS